MNIKVYKCLDEELRNEIRSLSSQALELMFKNKTSLILVKLQLCARQDLISYIGIIIRLIELY